MTTKHKEFELDMLIYSNFLCCFCVTLFWQKKSFSFVKNKLRDLCELRLQQLPDILTTRENAGLAFFSSNNKMSNASNCHEMSWTSNVKCQMRQMRHKLLTRDYLSTTSPHVPMFDSSHVPMFQPFGFFTFDFLHVLQKITVEKVRILLQTKITGILFVHWKSLRESFHTFHTSNHHSTAESWLESPSRDIESRACPVAKAITTSVDWPVITCGNNGQNRKPKRKNHGTNFQKGSGWCDANKIYETPLQTNFSICRSSGSRIVDTIVWIIQSTNRSTVLESWRIVNRIVSNLFVIFSLSFSVGLQNSCVVLHLSTKVEANVWFATVAGLWFS